MFKLLNFLYNKIKNINKEKGLFKEKWFNYYTSLPNKFDLILCCIDTASTNNINSNFSCATIWGYKKINNKLFLIDLLYEKKTYFFLKKDLTNFINKNKKFFKENNSLIYIENANIGAALYDELKRKIKFTKFELINRFLSKQNRAKKIIKYIKSGFIYLPKNKEIKTLFLNEVCNFNKYKNNKNDDITDTMIDAIEICYLKKIYKQFEKQKDNKL